ncbi:hypothetical protein CBOM_00984 [Ceraceosorus bombacis]|uniref:Uncharacterized protein n=1 Tax=Ceraceosorus bombacis TaxID=401625 RepID=A0A0P1BCJ9_9BASI|nr:hypothetical protein CBOM_00984 [Ceraceosorus bombacis]
MSDENPEFKEPHKANPGKGFAGRAQSHEDDYVRRHEQELKKLRDRNEQLEKDLAEAKAKK